MIPSDNYLSFKSEKEYSGKLKKKSLLPAWKIVIADDDEEVHAVTKLALEDFLFEDREIHFLSAFSGEETKALLRENPDTAILLLDIVMEKENTGLKIVEYVRRELGNSLVRIILRTGQPGQAPQMEVIRDFDINDYKEKIELTDQKLHTTLVASLRAYRDLRVLENTLREKEILLREIHHRVKNNLQVISSLLSMQSFQMDDPKGQSMFKESRDRIRSMALIHEKLYKSDNFNEILFGDYLDAVTQDLFSLYNPSGSIYRDLSFDRLSLDLDRAIPCGLIVNELITNALKYAFPENGQGTVFISFKETAPDTLSLSIRDTGCGLPEDIDYRNTKTLGMQLVSILCEQIEGELTVKHDRGTTFSLTFPKTPPVPVYQRDPK